VPPCRKQNEIIFEAEKERNILGPEHDDLKELAKFTRKGKLQSRIDRKNEEIDILKIGLPGISNRYGFHIVQDFYKSYASAGNAKLNIEIELANGKKAILLTF